MSYNNCNNARNYGAILQNECTTSASLPTPARFHIVNFIEPPTGNGSGINNNNSDDSDSDENKSLDIDLNALFLDDLNCSLITQIREQSGTGRDSTNIGPYRSQLQQIARSRRRPMIRTKSEGDFQMLMDDDIHKMHAKFLRGHNRHHHASTFNLKSVKKFTRRQKFVLASIALVDFTSFCAMSILAPFFPQEASKKGMPPWVSGFVFSVYALTVFIASPFMGKAVSLVGPKFLLTIGVFLGGCCNILFGLLDGVESLEMFTAYCFLVRIFEAVGAAAFATSSYTIVAKIFPDNIGVVLGVLETFVGLGMSFGPAIGGFLFDVGGYGLPFYSLGALMILTIPLNLYLLPSTDDDDMDSEPSESMWKLSKLPPIFILSLVIIVASNTWSFLDPTLEPHLRSFNFSAKELALFFLIASVLYAISSPLWGLLCDRIERTWLMMVVGLAVSSVGLLLIGPSPLIPLENSIWTNVVALIILGASISMTLLPTFEAMLDAAIERGYSDESSTYGLIGGLWSSMYSLGEVTGPSLGALMMDHFGFGWCSTVMAAICLVMAFVVFFYFQTSSACDESTCDSNSRQSIVGKMNTSDIYDSGISEESSGSTSVSVGGTNDGGEYGYTSNKSDEKLRLLNSESNMTSQRSSNGKLKSVASDVLVNVANSTSWSSASSSSSLESSVELDSSYPGVLRTLGITATGAIEI